MGWLDDLIGLIGSSDDLAGGDVGGGFDFGGGVEDVDVSGYGDVGYSAPMDVDSYDPYAPEAGDVDPFGGAGGGATQGNVDPFGGVGGAASAGASAGGSALSSLLSGAGKFLGGAVKGVSGGGAGGGGLSALIQQSPQIPGDVEGVDTYSAAPLAQPTPSSFSKYEPVAAQSDSGGLERLLARLGTR